MGSCCGSAKPDNEKQRSCELGGQRVAVPQTKSTTGVHWIPSEATKSLKNASSISLIPTNELTQVYWLPSKKFRTEEEVIKAHGYEIVSEVAKGGFATVYKAKKWDRSGSGYTDYACKVLDLSEDIDERQKTDTKCELFVLQRTSHPNVIKLFEHFMIRTENSVCVYLWLQWAPNDSLSKYMREIADPLTESIAKRMFAQIVAGVRHMHLKGIAHRDLKMGNILLDHNLNAIISDFGLSCVAYRVSRGGTLMSHTYCGTIPYMAPEILINRGTTKQPYNPFIADIWAMGVILYCMTNKAYPFDENNGFEAMIDSQINSKWKFSRFVKNKPSEELYHILKHLLEANCKKRITIGQLAQHIWIREDLKGIQV